MEDDFGLGWGQLAEKIEALMHELTNTQKELACTQTIIRDYNGLREQLNRHEARLQVIEAVKKEHSKFSKNFREWGSWVVAVLALALMWFKRG